MKQLIQGSLLGITRYNFDGNQGAKLFLQEPASPENEDSVGVEVMTLPGFYGAVDVARKHKLPGDFELECEMKKAAGGKAGLYVTGIRPLAASK